MSGGFWQGAHVPGGGGAGFRPRTLAKYVMFLAMSVCLFVDITQNVMNGLG